MALNTIAQENWSTSEAFESALGQSPWLIRPYSNGDADKLCVYFNGLTSTSLRLRFQYSMDTVHPSMLARYDGEAYPSNVAIVAYSGRESSEICGEALLACDPVNREAEIAISVGDQFQRRGLGSALIEQLIKMSTEMGILQVHADTLRSNRGFIALADSMGYLRQSHPDDRHQTRFIINTTLSALTKHYY